MNKTFTLKTHISGFNNKKKNVKNINENLIELDQELSCIINKTKSISFDVRQGVVDKILSFAKKI